MMGPARIDPKGERRVRFAATALKSLTQGNDIYVLSGKVGHVPSDKRPVPELHPFEVRYRSLGKTLVEISRQQPLPHYHFLTGLARNVPPVRLYVGGSQQPAPLPSSANA
jgi:hypothetical protein